MTTTPRYIVLKLDNHGSTKDPAWRVSDSAIKSHAFMVGPTFRLRRDAKAFADRMNAKLRKAGA